jgi:hypothetical protein
MGDRFGSVKHLGARPLRSLHWALTASIGSVLVVVISLLRLPVLGSGGAANYGWYTTASGERLRGLILDQVQYLQLADHFSGRAPAPTVAPFTSRSLGPWLAGQLGGDAHTALWAVNAVGLVLGTFALARLALLLTRSERWTVVAVLLWAVSWPVFWYTSKALVDPLAVGLMVCALLALYLRRLLPGLALLALAVWAKETALVLVPVAVTRELLHPAGPVVRGTRRQLRAASWVAAGAVAYLTAGLLGPQPELTFASWIPSSVSNSLRLAAMNFSASGFVQVSLTILPALLGSALWWRERRRGRRFLDDHDAVPLLVGTATAAALSAWSFFTALWDGRTPWTTLPFGALLLAAWCAQRPLPSPRRAVRLVLGAGVLHVLAVVAWAVLGGLFAGVVNGGAAAPLHDVRPRFAAADLVVEPTGQLEWEGQGDATVVVDTRGPALLRVHSDEALAVEMDGTAAVRSRAGSATILVDSAAPVELALSTDAGWTASLLRLDRALFWEGLSPIAGSGPSVVLFPGGLVRSIDMSSTGAELTAVGQCRAAECPELPVSSEGRVTVPAGSEALVIDAATSWELVPERPSTADDARVLEGTVSG